MVHSLKIWTQSEAINYFPLSEKLTLTYSTSAEKRLLKMLILLYGSERAVSLNM